MTVNTVNAAAHLYVGPTAYGLDPDLLQTAGLIIHPPVRRNDIAAMVTGTNCPGTIVIVDGTYHSYPAVGHAEIRQALESGWAVWGLSSMGAIRAAEMQGLGMRGYGSVFGQYLGPNGLDDDEVALIHTAEEPFRPLSEPLIHLRRFCGHLVERGIVESDTARSVIDQFKHRWYAERTLHGLRALLIAHPAVTATQMAAIDLELIPFGRFRTKSADLTMFLSQRIWDLQEEN